MAGGQREIAPGWFLGGSLGYETSRQRGDDGARVDGDAALAAVTLKRQTGPLLLAGAVDLGYGWLDSTRAVRVGTASETATASTNAFNAGLHLRASWQVPRERWYLQPGLELDATYVRVDGYTETGAGVFNRKVGASDDLILEATPFVRLGGRVNLDGGAVLNLHATTGVSFSSQDDWSTDVRFAGVPDLAGVFDSAIDAPDTIGRISAGVDIATTGRLMVSLLYDASVSSNQTTQSGLVRLSWRF